MIELALFTLNEFDILDSWINSEQELVQFSGPIFTYPLNKGQIEHYLDDNNRYVFKVVLSQTNDDRSQMVGFSEI